jgi:hypothetical protein
MKCVACERLAVPAGTAAAAVVAAAPSEDPVREARRFARLEALDDAGFRAAFEELVVSGVYAVLERTVLVVRVSAAGERRLAAVLAISGEDGAPPGGAGGARSGLEVAALALAADGDDAQRGAYRDALEEETRARPVFHGTCADGTTYSGFAAESGERILALASARLPLEARPAAIAVLAASAPLPLPRGLAVRLGAATD